MTTDGGGPRHRFDTPAHATLAYLHHVLGIEQEWTHRHADGFTWWASAPAQRFWVEARAESSGTDRYGILVETAVLRDVREESAVAQALVPFQNEIHQAGIAVLQDSRLRLRARLRLEAGQEHAAAELLAERALMQHVVAERLVAGAHQAQPQLGAIDASGPPGRRIRPTVHGVLDEVRTRIAGSVPGLPTRHVSLDGAASILSRAGQPAVGGDNEGWVAATQHYLAPARKQPGDPAPAEPAIFAELGSTEISIASSVNHPLYGRGTVVRVAIPIPDRITNQIAHAWARTYNRFELTDVAAPSVLGAWSSPRPQLTGSRRYWVHGSFHPTAMPFQIPSEVLATIAVKRSRWWMATVRRRVVGDARHS